jgi:lipopolysaccharide export system protein LptA
MKTLLPILLLLATLGAARAAENLPAATAPISDFKTAPGDIEIWADDGFDYDLLTGLAIWRGNVHATNVDNSVTNTLICQVLTVKRSAATNEPTPTATANLGDPGGTVESMVAEKDVVITQLDSRATGDKAVYEAATDTLTLTGNPRVQSKDGWMTASVFVFDRRNNKVHATPPIRLMGSGATGIFSLPGARPPK